MVVVVVVKRRRKFEIKYNISLINRVSTRSEEEDLLRNRSGDESCGSRQNRIRITASKLTHSDNPHREIRPVLFFGGKRFWWAGVEVFIVFEKFFDYFVTYLSSPRSVIGNRHSREK